MVSVTVASVERIGALLPATSSMTTRHVCVLKRVIQSMADDVRERDDQEVVADSGGVKG